MPHELPQLRRVVANRSAVLGAADGRERRVALGESVGPWTLRAAWKEDKVAFAALESEAELCITSDGPPEVRAVMARPFGAPASLAGQDIPRFGAAYYEALVASPRDRLAREARRGGELSFAAVADLLPPVLDMTFLGDERAFERPIVRPDGAIEDHFEAAFPLDTDNPAARHRHGLLAGGMNAVCYARFDEDTGQGVEMIAFALADDAAGDLAVYRRLREVGPAGEALRHERSCGGRAEVGGEFYAALLRAWERDRRFFARGAQVRVPERVVQEAVSASMRLGDLTFRGVLPRYGVGQYDQERHHSFPPATIFLAWACMEWGRFDRARDILSHYLARYVKPDGTFDYYGPAVAEYGQMLFLCARLVQLTADRDWWDDHLVIIRRMARRLLELREESLDRNAGDALHCGLIPGLPEADYHGDPAQWERYYFAGDVWVCRGLREVGKALKEDTATAAEGARLVEEATAYERQIRSAVRAAAGPRGFVPAGPDEPPPFERMTESRHASYCNYRYLPEMMSAGILAPGILRRIVRYRRGHGGELLGMTRFEDHLDDWPAWHHARGLLDLDDIDGCLLTFYGHLAHHHSRGNWASYEQVRIEPGEGAHRSLAGGAEQVVPCQVMAPLMLKHMLVDEERDHDTLILLRACPAAWLEAEEGVRFDDIPTRWGPVGLRARRRGDTTDVRLRLDFGERRPWLLFVRLALPEGGVRSVTVNGERQDLTFDLGDIVAVDDPGPGLLHIVARHGQTGGK